MIMAFANVRPARLLGLAVVSLALAGMTGCVSMEEHQRLRNAWETSKQQLAEAERDVATLRQRVSTLQAQIDRSQGVGEGVAALRQERDLLKAQLAKLQSDYNKLLEMAGTPQLPPAVNDALAKLAEQYPDLLEYDADQGRVRFKSDLTFDLGSTDVKPRAKEALVKLAGILNVPEIANHEIRIVGYTDDVPIRQSKTMTMNPSNWYLSTNRGQSVRQVLESDGVSPLRMQVAGWGEYRPVAPNAPGHKGNEQNRRVEIYVLPSQVPAGLTLDSISTPAGGSRQAVRTTTPAAPAGAPAGNAGGGGVPMPGPVR
jgi:chemotaxis protein MotB